MKTDKEKIKDTTAQTADKRRHKIKEEIVEKGIEIITDMNELTENAKEEARNSEREKIKKMLLEFEENGCEWCGTPKYCVDGETECQAWKELKKSLLEKDEVKE